MTHWPTNRPRSDELSGFERLIYWDWDVAELAGDFAELVRYYWQTYGIEAMVVTAAVVIAVLLSWRVTREPMAKIVETVTRTLIRAVIYTSTFVFVVGGRWLFGRALVYSRWLSRTVADMFR